MSDAVTVTITQQKNYQFLVDFGDAIPTLIADESVPLGEGEGPTPTHFLLAGVANCLSASLLFALQKFKQDAGGLTSKATCTMGRNEQNRIRIQAIEISMQFKKPGSELDNIARILEQFEAFCTVSQSVQAGIPIKVSVVDGDGTRLK